ncbi:maltooligosyltrehalose trehalohydrolase [Marisediminicola sp. UYEF4]|uniref:malto-oligosyltrehalose trehalohydrolase n=1 Tax=Marisediminicola sp. UYEF4 TaxID=1756384 RepID=UPI003399D21D
MIRELWAPRAGAVALLADGQTHPMTAGENGWWSVDAPAPASAYGFLLDDDETPLPDPRSRRQPDGVHGLSRDVDPAGFAWTDGAWTGRQLAGGMIYELHLGTFTPDGTLDSAIDRLDHLVSLGVDFVELLPVNGFNGTHNWGYDGVAWFTVSETYGGPEAYQRFVDACHARGLAVIQDVVHNHLGPSGNYLPRFGPYLHEASANTWGSSVNLDSPEVRRFILDNVAMWMRDYHVDGLRLDAVHALIDTSPKHLLQEMAEETDALSAYLGRPLILIAESDLNDPKLITPREAGGYGLPAQWSDDFHHAVHVALTGEVTGYYADFAKLESLAKVLTKGFYHDGTFSSFRERDHGGPVDTENMPTWRLVVANQNHDQIGNRAIGDRLSASLDYGQLAIAAVLTLAGPFTPMLFMGEEWGASTPWQFFTSHPEPELGTATAEGRIREFEKMGWDPAVVPDPQAPSTFTNSKLDWSELQSGDHARLLAVYRALARLRAEHPEFTDPRFTQIDAEFDEDARWFVLHRGGASIVINFAASEQELPHSGRVLLATDAATALTPGGISLPAHSAVILAR